MKKTRMLALAMAVCLCLGLVPAASAAVPAGNWKFKEILPCEYDEVKWGSYGVLGVSKGGKWGLVSKAGETITPCQYEDMRWVDNDYETQSEYWAVRQGGKWGLIDQTGAALTPCQYDEMGERGYTMYSGNERKCLLRVKQNGKQGFIDQTGAVIIPLTYADARDFSGNYAAVADAQGKWGFIDTQGETVIACQYSAAGDFCGNPSLAPVKTAAGKWQFIDRMEETQITCQGSYDWVDGFDYRTLFAVVTRGQKKGLIDREGKEAMPCRYDDIQVGWTATEWSEESWTVYGNKKTYSSTQTGWQYGLFSADGAVDTGLIYERTWELYPLYFEQGLASVSKFTGQVSASGYPDYIYGFVDTTGKEVIPCQYEWASDFYGGPAAVELDGKAGFIDTTGRVVIPMTYSRASGFDQDGLAAVATGTYPNYQWGIIDAQGNTVIPCSYTYQWMNTTGDGLIWVQKNNKQGLAALVAPGADGSGLPLSGSMDSDREGYYDYVSYTCSKLGKLTLETYLAEGQMVLAATYDAKGKLTKAEVLTAEQSDAWLDTTAAQAKLFWLDRDGAPLSMAATLWAK